MNDEEITLIPSRRYTTKIIKTRDGVTHELYSLSALANSIERHPHTIRQWEKKKIIPPPLLLKAMKTNQRFYLLAEIRAYMYAVGKSGIDRGTSINKSGFKQLIREQLASVKANFDNQITENINEKVTNEANQETKSRKR